MKINLREVFKQQLALATVGIVTLIVVGVMTVSAAMEYVPAQAHFTYR